MTTDIMVKLQKKSERACRAGCWNESYVVGVIVYREDAMIGSVLLYELLRFNKGCTNFNIFNIFKIYICKRGESGYR